jgi:hypothetical protein
MSLDICLVGARWRCVINDKYSVVISVSNHVDHPDRYDNLRFWPFYKDGKQIDEIPGVDKEKVKERIVKIIKSLEKPLIKEKELK